MGITFASSKYATGANVDIQGAMTICAWILTTSVSAVNCFIAAAPSGGVPVQYRFLCQTDRKLAVEWYQIVGQSKRWLSTSAAISTNTLSHVAAVRDANLDWTLVMVNGASVAGTNTTTGTPVMQGEQTIGIGRSGAGALWYLIGPMWDCRLYDIDLTAEEIVSIYHSRGRDGITRNLKARWLMNEGQTGDTASGTGSMIDISPNGYHETPTGSPTYLESPMKLFRGY